MIARDKAQHSIPDDAGSEENESNSLDRAQPALGRKARVVEVLGSAPPVCVALGIEEVGLPHAVWCALAVVVNPAVVGAARAVTYMSIREGVRARVSVGTHQERTRSALHVAA